MNENIKLLKIQRLLKSYFSYFKDPDILVISEDKSVLPFAYIINDYSHPKTLLLSVAVDYSNSTSIAEVTLCSSLVNKTTLSESFYISSVNGETFFGPEAYARWELETLKLDNLEPLSKEIH